MIYKKNNAYYDIPLKNSDCFQYPFLASGSTSLAEYFTEQMTVGKVMDNILRRYKRSGYIRECDCGVECLKPKCFYVVLCEVLDYKINDSSKAKDSLWQYASKRRDHLWKLYACYPKAKDYAYLLFNGVAGLEINYVLLYLIAMSDEEQDKEYFYQMVKSMFRQQFKRAQELKDDLMDWRKYNEVDVQCREMFVYNYFFHKMDVNTILIFHLVCMLLSVTEVENRVSIIHGKIPEGIKTGLKREIQGLYSNLDSRKPEEKVSITKLWKIFGYNSCNELVPDKGSLIMPAAVAAAKAAEQLHVKTLDGDEVDWLLPVNAAMVSSKGVSDNMLDFFFKLIVPMLSMHTHKKEESKDQQGIAEERIKDERCLELEHQVAELKKELNKTQKALSHEQAENLRMAEKLKTGQEKGELESIHEEDNDEEDIDIYPSLEDAILYLQKKRVIVVGGHEHWVRQFQEIFPRWNFCTECTRTVSQKAQDMDLVVFNTRHMGHALFDKYIAMCRNGNIPRQMLNSINITQAILQVYNFLSSLEARGN